MAQRFKLKGKTYKLNENLDKLPLIDILLFDEQVAEIGLHATWGEVLLWSQEIAEMNGVTEGSHIKHPRMMLVLTATLWASRRLNGEKVTFGETVEEFSLDDLDWVEPTNAGPKDHRRKAAKKSPPRKASAPVASAPEPSEPESASTTPASSSPLSAAG
jgi:hypothetical protein